MMLIEILSSFAALFAFLAFVRSFQKPEITTLLRTETDTLKQYTEEQIRSLRTELEKKIADTGVAQTNSAKDLREEVKGSFATLGSTIAARISELGEHQKERLDSIKKAVETLTEKNEKSHESLKQAVENKLEAIRTENAAKLDEMRKTVDEKLQTTLETRLGESFNRVVEQLTLVHKGIGEMQTLATGVGDLKKILSNVRARGTFGEVQAGTLLEQFLSPEQYVRNAQVKENSLERVEFAIKFPGRSDGEPVLLPVDAKFPQEDYERLVIAAEQGDADALADASKSLESRIKIFAKGIRDKYINVPATTDFAILFLPTESLYAEILRRPGLFEQIQRDYKVTLTGPTTFVALLNAFKMGFQSVAIERRSSEIWKVLGAVKNEFSQYNDVVNSLSKQLQTVANSVTRLGTRTRVMNKALKDVEKVSDGETSLLLGAQSDVSEEDESADAA